VRGLLADDLPPLARSAATLMLMPFLFSPFIGIAEGPLVAYATVGVLHVRRGLRQSSRGDVLLGAVLLGFAAWCKNEGLALVFSVAVGMALVRAWRMLPLLWPALAIPLPWILLHRMHGLRVDLAEGGALERLMPRLADPWPVIAGLLARTGMSEWFWLGIALALLLGLRRLAAEERFLLAVVALQVCIYVGVYFTTPRDLNWHIVTSWHRVLLQVMPLIVIALFPTFSVIASLTRRGHATDPRTDRPPSGPGAA
jgi:MFS family permease